MNNDKETPERLRERLRQEELRGNPPGNMNDAFNRTTSGGLADLVGSLGWKGIVILILATITGYIIVLIFF